MARLWINVLWISETRWPLKDVKYEGDLETVACPPCRERRRWRMDLGGGGYGEPDKLSTICITARIFSLQCSDTVAWATGRASDLWKAGCWFVGDGSLTGALHVLYLGRHQLRHACSYRIQNRVILVTACPVFPGKLCRHLLYPLTAVVRYCWHKAGEHGGLDRGDNGRPVPPDWVRLVCVLQQ